MDCNKSIKLFLDKVQEAFSFDAVAVRVSDPIGYIPFVVHNGLTDAFIEDESLISINDCVCGKVARSNTHDDFSFFTERGSFWSNFLKEEIAEEVKKSGIEPRGRCLREGYKTLLITQISNGNGIRGNLYLASRKENLLTKEDVVCLEDAAIRLGKEVFTKMTECERYNIITRYIAQGNGEDKKPFSKYFEHLKTCPSCYAFYNHNLKLDNYIIKALAPPSYPQKLRSKIMDELSCC